LEAVIRLSTITGASDENEKTDHSFYRHLRPASGAALAADTGAQSNNGQANSSADAGQVAPDARENVAPNNVDNARSTLAAPCFIRRLDHEPGRDVER
jgi:hypothetical protein